MYGTIARMRVKPGNEDRLAELLREFEDLDIPGYRGTFVYRLEGAPSEHLLAVMFDSKEQYVANASSPEQNERYLEYLELLEGEPEWNDGEIVYHVSR